MRELVDTVEMRVSVATDTQQFNSEYRMPKADWQAVGPAPEPHPDNLLAIAEYRERRQRRRDLAQAIGTMIARRLMEAIEAEEERRSR